MEGWEGGALRIPTIQSGENQGKKWFHVYLLMKHPSMLLGF